MCLMLGCSDIIHIFRGAGMPTIVCYIVRPRLRRDSYLTSLVNALENVDWRYIQRKVRLYIARTAIDEVSTQRQHLIFWDIPFVGALLRIGQGNFL